MIIAIDGPAAAGKGTLARRLAQTYGLPYLDTGLLYRAIGRRVLSLDLDPADAEVAERAALALTADDLHQGNLRGPDADRAASLVASVPGVRRALLGFQRSFAAKGGVLDGRDIGTVIFPDARIKFFVTASVAARAYRRWSEMAARGQDVAQDEVEADLRRRDALDEARASAPLLPASDAILIDTTDADADAVFVIACRLIDAALAAG